jgi:hypothetical protein
MAFKMNPGRGNYSKTGRSIPTPFKQVDIEVDRMIARRKASNENESKAKADSTAVDNKLRKAGFSGNTPGEMGNKKANETRATLKGGLITSVNKDKSTGKYKKTYGSSPAKQVDKEVEAMISRKKASGSKAKTEKARSEGEAMRAKLEQAVKNKTMAETNKRASADSTAVDKKMRLAGFTGNTPGEMGNKKANETRKAGSAYKNIYDKVVLDKSTGKYKKVIGSDSGDVPTRQMKKSPMKQTDPLKIKTAKGPSKNSMPTPKNPKSGANKIPPGTKMDGDLSKSGKKYGSPAKQLGRQAVTKMGGKKAPAKMKKC